VPAIGSRSVAWIGLDSPAKALELLLMLEASLGDAVESFELVPDVALQLVLQHIPNTRAPLTGNHAWHVLVEATAPMVAPSPDKALTAALHAAIEAELLQDAVIAANEAQAEAFWRIRDSISEAEQKDGPNAKHDVSVEVPVMPAFIVEATASVEARFPGVRVIAFGHLGDGNVHFNVRAPEGAGPQWLRGPALEVTSFVHDQVVAAGARSRPEHGIGQVRLSELGRTDRCRAAEHMRAIKQALDPNGIMNPGKLVPGLGAAKQSLAEAGTPQ
jgi:FAD/FMN-containing dehydrogenase